MKLFMLLMLMLGAALLGLILYQTDLAEVWDHLLELGAWGIAIILFVHLVGFFFESASWLLTLPQLPLNHRWLFRIARVLGAGYALEMVTPLAGLGGEPIKAVILKRYYAIPYRDAMASQLLTRTTDVISQIPFIAMGLGIMLFNDLLPPAYRTTAILSLLLFSVCVLMFLLVQRGAAFQWIRSWLKRVGSLTSGSKDRPSLWFAALGDIERRVVEFYSARRWRFVLSVGAAFCGWMTGALAAYLTLGFLGHPITFAEGIVIEAFMILVRSAFFFVPGDIGTQEGALVLACAQVTGSPSLGLALAAVRRAKDILWILSGLAIGTAYSIRPAELLKRNPSSSLQD